MRAIYTEAQFYNDPTTGRPGANLNLGNFANSTNDSWRPAELLADAVYIQSGTFKDGFVSTIFVGDELGASTTFNGAASPLKTAIFWVTATMRGHLPQALAPLMVWCGVRMAGVWAALVQ
jgi:hypothetical protein